MLSVERGPRIESDRSSVVLEAIEAVIVFGFFPLVNAPFGLIAGSAASSS
jgi:hypothetical protein